jgi:hypothetical protein
VATGRATIIDVGSPIPSPDAAATWIGAAGEDDLAAGLAVLNRALRAHRLITADPHVPSVGRELLLVARLGYGVGEEVADGLWTRAIELEPPRRRSSRQKVLQPQARLAAVLGAREELLVCEELLLRARADISDGDERTAALGLLVALDAALAELAGDPAANALADRLTELRAQRDPVTAAAQAALAGPLSSEHRETVKLTLGRIEAALRARAVGNA